MGKGPSKRVNFNRGEVERKSEDVKSRPSYHAEVPVDPGEAVSSQSSQYINVMFVCSEWGSSKGGLSTFNRELAVNLAKYSKDNIRVHCFVCESTEEDRRDASRQGVNLITARRPPGSSDPLEWLKIPPPELPHPDIVVGHGRKFGSAAYFISDRTKCRWVHFVHVFCEDLGKFKLEYSASSDAIAENEEKNRRELELCGAADRVVAVGVGLQRKYVKRIPNIKVITPGLFEKFAGSRSRQLDAAQTGQEFRVFMFGRGSFEDFALKGYDIVAKAVASLGRMFELTFVGASPDEHRKIEKWFLEEAKTLARNQLTIRGFCDSEEMKKMFREADLIVMPSRTEGFGLVALEAISAGVPVLVSSECGIARALLEVDGGISVVVKSDLPEDWANRIRELSEQKPEERHGSAIRLREQYGKKYSWKQECEKFKQMIQDLMQMPRKAFPLHCLLSDQSGNMTMKVEAVLSPEDKGAQTDKNGKMTVNKAEASVLSQEDKGAQTDQGGSSTSVSSISPTDAGAKRGKADQYSKDHAIAAPHTADETEQTKRNKKGVSATDPDTSDKTAEQTKSSIKGLQATGGASASQDNKESNQLHSAALLGDVTKIESLLSLGFPVDSRNATNKTPLMIAAWLDKLQAVKCLLGKGASPSLEDNDGWNSLHFASHSGNTDIIELLLLTHGPDIDSTTAKCKTSLMIAAVHGQLQAVTFLIGKRASPSLEDKLGWNSLHLASFNGNTVIIDTLLSYGVDIESKTQSGQTPLMIARDQGHTEAVTYLVSKGAKSD